MKNEFVPYDVALAMKELEFDEPCVAVYYGDYDERDFENGIALEYRESQYYAQKGWSKGLLAPLYQQAFRWFREEYDMAHEITYAGAKGRYNAFTDDWVYDSNGELKKFSYEEAELACLRKIIEIINQNKEDE